MILTDQAQALRRLAAEVAQLEEEQTRRPAPPADHASAVAPPAPRPRARVLAVTSGKGGVGKSNVSVNLAICMARQGQRVILMDGDLGTANADVLCNIAPRSTLNDVVNGHQNLRDILIEGPGGFLMLPGASGLAQLADMSPDQRTRLIRQLRGLDEDADLLLIDTGAGVGPDVLGFALCADEVLVVTTPEPPAVTDAYAVIKSLAQQSDQLDLRLLVNMAHTPEEGQEVFARMDSVCRRFLNLTIRFAGTVPYDPELAAAVRQREPLVLRHHRSPAALALIQLSRRLVRVSDLPRGDGLWRRVGHWLGVIKAAP